MEAAGLADQWNSFEESYAYAQRQQQQRVDDVPFSGRKIDEGDFAAWNLKWQEQRDAKVRDRQRQQSDLEAQEEASMNVGLEIPSHDESERYLAAAPVYMGPISGWYHHQAQQQQQQIPDYDAAVPTPASRSDPLEEEDRFRLSELGGYTPYTAKSAATTPRGTPRVPIHERLYRDAKQKMREKEQEQAPPLVDAKTGRPLFQPTVNRTFEAPGQTSRRDLPAGER